MKVHLKGVEKAAQSRYQAVFDKAGQEAAGGHKGLRKVFAGVAKETAREMRPNLAAAIEDAGGNRKAIRAAILADLDPAKALELAEADLLHADGPMGAGGIEDIASEADVDVETARAAWGKFLALARAALAGKSREGGTESKRKGRPRARRPRRTNAQG